MDRDQESQLGGSETPPATSAAAELAARVDDVVRTFAANIGTSVEPTTLEALRAAVLELARAHAARTVLEAVTARHTPRRRRPWGRRP